MTTRPGVVPRAISFRGARRSHRRLRPRQKLESTGPDRSNATILHRLRCPLTSSSRKTPMNPFSKTGRLAGTSLACVAALGVVAVANHLAARWAERKHPPKRSFLEVDGVRLHYSDRGSGSPIVLIHGNGVTGDDFSTSGLAELLMKTHRVIIFDRPGFGYSERPRGRIWSANAQADLVHKALQQLDIERPFVVGQRLPCIAVSRYSPMIVISPGG
jgi:hypothetical protein